jgi:hypothetical protein
MTILDQLDRQVRDLHDRRFKEFEAEVVRHKTWNDRGAKYEKAREERRLDVLKSIGIGLKGLDAARAEESRLQEKELASFLDEFRSICANRPSQAAADAREAAVVSGTLHAFARGGGAYAELNFEAGANHIEPLLLNELQV